MTIRYIDIHPHIISPDEGRYPHVPLFGKQSDWSKERPITIEDLIRAMDEAAVEKAAIVHSSTCYGYDNSYVTDAVSKHSDRFVAVGSVDVLQADAPTKIREWVSRGLGGLRLFTGGSTASFDPSSLDSALSFPSWELCEELGLSMAIQTDPSGLAQVAGLAKRFSRVRIVLDHLGRPDVTDGPPYKKSSSLFGLIPFENIYLKLTPRIFGDVKKGSASAETFFAKLVEGFGSHRLAWGSNYPTSEGNLKDNLAVAKQSLATLEVVDQEWIFGKTAQVLYPALG